MFLTVHIMPRLDILRCFLFWWVNENKLREHGVKCAVEMLEAAGCIDIKSYNSATDLGACFHEMGTARMGHAPKPVCSINGIKCMMHPMYL